MKASSSSIIKNDEYNRYWSSKNCRKSPFSIELIIFNSVGEPIHNKYCDFLMSIIRCVYLWNPDSWLESLREDDNRSAILRTKSDFFWESLAQHVSERVFNVHVTPAVYLFGPIGEDGSGKSSNKTLHCDAHRLILITKIEGGTDPLNPVSRTITFISSVKSILCPEIFIEVSVPSNILLTVSPYQEVLDMRPRVKENRNSNHNYTIRAHIPPVRKRMRNTDYPDFCLFFIPCRHLVFQGHVVDPRCVSVGDGIYYGNLTACLDRFQFVVEKLRFKPGSLEVVADIAEFITSKYYYAYDDYHYANHEQQYSVIDSSRSNSTDSSGSLMMEPPSFSPESSANPSDDYDFNVPIPLTARGLPHFCVEKFDLAKFREYILSDTYGVGRGLACDFDFVELCVDGTYKRTVRM